MSAPNIVLLGGGTGSFTLLQGLKKLTSNITAIVNMSDDGGSTGTLRDELGVLPPGDIRQCLVALSDNPEVRNLFSYRFSDGRFDGQSLGNIILSGLELQHGGMEEAIRVAGELLHITGQVVPVTLHKHTLVATDGMQIYKGEHVIDGAVALGKQAIVHLEPEAHLNPRARAAIAAADMVVLAPGSVHTSLLPILAVNGMAVALKDTKATVVYVSNLVNKPLQTDNWHVADYVEQFERYAGSGTIDYVLYNTEEFEPELLKLYVAEDELPVGVEAAEFKRVRATPIGTALVSHLAGNPKKQRTLIRHDATAVCAELEKLLPN